MKEIKQTWHFDHTPQRVWEYLTDAELLSQWLMKNDIKPVVGHKFMFTAKPAPQIDFDGQIFCEVLEVLPLKKLAYSWKGGPGNGVITLNSVVTWVLEPKDNGTQLHLSQTGFDETINTPIYEAMNKGWSDHIHTRLQELINKTK